MCFGVDDPFAKIRWLDERASGREHDFGEFIVRYVRDIFGRNMRMCRVMKHLNSYYLCTTTCANSQTMNSSLFHSRIMCYFVEIPSLVSVSNSKLALFTTISIAHFWTYRRGFNAYFDFVG